MDEMRATYQGAVLQWLYFLSAAALYVVTIRRQKEKLVQFVPIF